MFEMMYGAYDLEGITNEDLIHIVFSYVMDKKILELENRERKGKSCRACEGSAMQSDDGHNKNRWMKYGDLAISSINQDIMWSVIEEACRVLALSTPSEKQRLYFDILFDMSWMLWEEIFINVENSARIERLTDFILCLCRLKFR